MKRLPTRTADRVLAEAMAGLARTVSAPRLSPSRSERRLLPRPRAAAEPPVPAAQTAQQEIPAAEHEQAEAVARRA